MHTILTGYYSYHIIQNFNVCLINHISFEQFPIVNNAYFQYLSHK